MKTVLAFGASNAQDSINAQLARYATTLLSGAEVIFIDLNDFEMPIFSLERERAEGIPEAAQRFKELIRKVDGIIISFAEHNGSYTVAFKNLLDWTSRIEKSTWLQRPLCFLATSPGARGGASVLQAALSRAPHMDGVITSSFSLPSFADHFNPEEGISDSTLDQGLRDAISLFQGQL